MRQNAHGGADAVAEGHANPRHSMVTALIAQLLADTRSGLAAIGDWRCPQLDALAVRLTEQPDCEADADLVVALVCGGEDVSLLTESALSSVLQTSLRVLEPASKTITEPGAFVLLDVCEPPLHVLFTTCPSKVALPLAGTNGSGHIQHMLRILDGCLYCPALAKVGSVRSEHIRLFCAVFALSLEAKIPSDSATAAGTQTATSEQVLF